MFNKLVLGIATINANDPELMFFNVINRIKQCE